MSNCKTTTPEQKRKILDIFKKLYPEKTTSEHLEMYKQQLLWRRKATVIRNNKVKYKNFRNDLKQAAIEFNKTNKNLIEKNNFEELYHSVFVEGFSKDQKFDRLFNSKGLAMADAFIKSNDVRNLAKMVGLEIPTFPKAEIGKEPLKKFKEEYEAAKQAERDAEEERINRLTTSFGFDEIINKDINKTILSFNKEYFKNIDEKNQAIRDIADKKIKEVEPKIEVVKTLKTESEIKDINNITPDDMVFTFENVKELIDNGTLIIKKEKSRELKQLLEDQNLFDAFFETDLEKPSDYVEFKDEVKMSGSSLILSLRNNVDSKIAESWGAIDERQKAIDEKIAAKNLKKEKFNLETIISNIVNGKTLDLKSYETPVFKYMNENYEHAIDTDGISKFRDKTTGEIVTIKKLSNDIKDIILKPHSIVEEREVITPISISDVKNLEKTLPSDVIEKILNSRISLKDLPEKKMKLVDAKNNILFIASKINSLSKVATNKVKPGELTGIYNRFIDVASKEFESDILTMKLSMKELSKNVDLESMKSFQSIMKRFGETHKDVFFIDVTENQKLGTAKKIHEENEKGKTLYLKADFINKKIDLFNTIKTFHKSGGVSAAGNATKASFSENSINLASFDLKTGLVKENESNISSYVKRLIEKEHMNEKDFNSVTVDRAMRYLNERLNKKYDSIENRMEEIDKMYERIGQSDINYIKEFSNDLIVKQKIFKPKDKASRGKFLLAERNAKNMIKRFNLDVEKESRVGKAELNKLNYKLKTMKVAKITNTSNGLNLKFVNDRSIDNKPAIFDYFITKTKDGYSLKTEQNELGKSDPMFFDKDRQGYEYVDYLFNASKKGTSRDQKLISATNKDIDAFNTMKRQEVYSTIYKNMTKGLAEGKDYVKSLSDSLKLDSSSKAILDEISKIPQLSKAKDLDVVIQKISLYLTGKFNNFHNIPLNNELYAKEVMTLAKGITFKEPTLIEVLKDKSKAMSDVRRREHNAEWVEKQTNIHVEFINKTRKENKALTRDIEDMKTKTSKISSELKSRDIDSKQRLKLAGEFNKIKDSIKKVETTIKNNEIEMEDRRRFVDAVESVGSESRRDAAILIFNNLVESGKWEAGTKSYTPDGELRFEDTVSMVKDMVGEFKAKEYTSEDEAPDTIKAVEADTTETRSKIKDLKDIGFQDINTWSKAIRTLDFLTKSEVSTKVLEDQVVQEYNFINNIESTDLESHSDWIEEYAKDTSGEKVIEKSKIIKKDEALGSYSINKHPELFMAGKNLYNIVRPFLEADYSLNKEEYIDSQMTSSEPNSKYSEEVEGNEKYEC